MEQDHAIMMNKFANIPTVQPIVPFNPRADAEILRKAIKGLGTNKKALITVLCRRTEIQRQNIVDTYKTTFGKELIPKIKKKTKGEFENLLVALCESKASLIASEINHAISEPETNESTLIEILVSGTNQEIRDIGAAYEKLYSHSLEEAVGRDTSDSFKTLLVTLAKGIRDENSSVDANRVREDALSLYKAGEAKLDADDCKFISILTKRSWLQVRQIAVEYQNAYGESLEKAIKSQFSGNTEEGLLTILRCAENQASYFAERLNETMMETGTKDRSLIRILVGHCDTDLGSIKMEYVKLYRHGIAVDIAKNASGDYSKGLLALVS